MLQSEHASSSSEQQQQHEPETVPAVEASLSELAPAQPSPQPVQTAEAEPAASSSEKQQQAEPLTAAQPLTAAHAAAEQRLANSFAAQASLQEAAEQEHPAGFQAAGKRRGKGRRAAAQPALQGAHACLAGRSLLHRIQSDLLCCRASLAQHCSRGIASQLASDAAACAATPL